MENHFDRPLKTVTKWANVGCLALALFFLGAVIKMTFVDGTFNTGNAFDDWYGLIASWIASVGFLGGSIVWFRYRLINNV